MGGGVGKGKSRRTDDVKISSGVCDSAIETEIILKAEKRHAECSRRAKEQRRRRLRAVAIKKVIL